MPLPTPRGDESEQDFVSRFMGNDQAISDFPDEKQRAAVAYRTYRDEDEEMEELELPGVSILEEGEAKGHDLFVDKVSLEKALEIMKAAKNGVKVKMNHGSGLHDCVGFARNPRIEGNRLVADLRLLRNSPHYGLIKEMAAEAPDQFGVSLAFVNESETIDGKDYIRPQSIASADLVSSPAATNGLFEEMLAFMEKIKKFDCGTGAGGFKPGNTCAGGDGESNDIKIPSDSDYKNKFDSFKSQKMRPLTRKEAQNLKSVGHIGYTKDKSREIYRDQKGDIYSAPLDNVIDVQTGNRIGRYEAPPHLAGKFAKQIMMQSKESFGYMAGGKPIPVDLPEAVVEGEGLTKEENQNMENDYKKDMDEIKVRLAALEKAMQPKDEEKKNEVKAEEAPKIVIEKEDEEKEESKEEMSEVVKKVLTEFGIKPVPASPVTEEAPAKKEEPKNFEALVAAHPEYKNSKLNAMKAVMLSNPTEYREALARGIKNI